MSKEPVFTVPHGGRLGEPASRLEASQQDILNQVGSSDGRSRYGPARANRTCDLAQERQDRRAQQLRQRSTSAEGLTALLKSVVLHSRRNTRNCPRSLDD